MFSFLKTQQILAVFGIRGSTLEVVLHISFWSVLICYKPCFAWSSNWILL